MTFVLRVKRIFFRLSGQRLLNFRSLVNVVMSKEYHVLNGEALRQQLPRLEGEIIVFQECLVDGPVASEVSDHWKVEIRTIIDLFGTKRFIEKAHFTYLISNII